MTTPERKARMRSTPLIGRRRFDGADVPGAGTQSRYFPNHERRDGPA
jgi:hypothetical protein